MVSDPPVRLHGRRTSLDTNEVSTSGLSKAVISSVTYDATTTLASLSGTTSQKF